MGGASAITRSFAPKNSSEALITLEPKRGDAKFGKRRAYSGMCGSVIDVTCFAR